MRRFTHRLSMVKGTNGGENPPDQTHQNRFAGSSGATESACGGKCSRFAVAGAVRLHPVACRLSVGICGVASTARDRSSTAHRLDASIEIEVDSKSPETASQKSRRCQRHRTGFPRSSTVPLTKAASSSKTTTCSVLRRHSSRSTRQL